MIPIQYGIPESLYSVLRIQYVYPGSRIHGQKDSRIRIPIKEFKYPGGKKAPDPRIRIRNTGYFSHVLRNALPVAKSLHRVF